MEMKKKSYEDQNSGSESESVALEETVKENIEFELQKNQITKKIVMFNEEEIKLQKATKLKETTTA